MHVYTHVNTHSCAQSQVVMLKGLYTYKVMEEAKVVRTTQPAVLVEEEQGEKTEVKSRVLGQASIEMGEMAPLRARAEAGMC